LTVQTYVSNDQDAATERLRARDVVIQICLYVRESSVVYHENLYPEETAELEIRSQESQTYHGRWLDCRFELVSDEAIAVDRAKTVETVVA